MELDLRGHLHGHCARQAAAREARARPHSAPAHRHHLGRRVPVRAGGGVSPAAGGLAWGLPAGIVASDIEFISLWTLVAALVISAAGIVALRLLARRSIQVMVAGVVLVCLFTSMAGVAIIAVRMLSGINKDVVLDLMAIAGLSGV